MVESLHDEDHEWSSLLFDPDFASSVRDTVRGYDGYAGIKKPSCTCEPPLPITPRASTTAVRPQLPSRSWTYLNVFAYTPPKAPEYNRQLGIDEMDLPVFYL